MLQQTVRLSGYPHWILSHVDNSYANNTNKYTELLLSGLLLHDIFTNHMSHWIYTLTNASAYRKFQHTQYCFSTQPNNTSSHKYTHHILDTQSSSLTDHRTHSPMDTQSPGLFVHWTDSPTYTHSTGHTVPWTHSLPYCVVSQWDSGSYTLYTHPWQIP